jgi:hypothetical protein
MPNLTSDLRDPSPPVPGERERAVVATRAHQLGRRRRLAQGAGALAVIAAVTVSVAALAGGGSGPSAGRVEAANSGADSAVATTAPPSANAAPAGSGFTVSGTVGNIPEGVIVTLTITGDGGTFQAAVDDAGKFVFSDVPAGTYAATYEWVDSSGTATQVGRLGSFDIANDSSVDFSL